MSERTKPIRTNLRHNFRQKSRKKYFIPTPNDVTEESLQIWLGLPSKIRHDPSLASFQTEHERLHGQEPEEFSRVEELELQEQEETESVDQPDYITINVLNKHSKTKSVENISCTNSRESEKEAKTEEHQSCVTVNSRQKNIKIVCLVVGWLILTAILTQKKEKNIIYKQIAVPEFGTKYFTIPEQLTGSQIAISLEGSFERTNLTTNYLFVSLEAPDRLSTNSSSINTDTYKNIWKLSLAASDQIDIVPQVIKRKIFDLSNLDVDNLQKRSSDLKIKFQTNCDEGIAVKMGYDISPVNINVGVIYAGVILVVLYVLIIWEIVHRTFAAIIASVSAIATLAILNDRPTMEDIVVWMDIETLLLIFSMMILVAILTETGVFDHIAVYTFKITNGKIWPLIHCLCLITLLVSSFLDNVTTILLMTPITIRLCEVMDLNPIPVLMAIVVHANTGGTLTPVGDPPNIIITSNQYIAKHGVTFLTFTLHMTVGIILVMIQTGIQLRIQYRDIHTIRLSESKEIKEIRREITVWKRAAMSLSSYPKKVDIVRDTLLSKIKILQHKLKKMELSGTTSNEAYKCTLEELKHNYPIKNKELLIKSGLVLTFVVVMFFIQSFPQLQRLSLGWCALLGVILLLIIAGRDNMDTLMHRIEWTTLLFFAAMFVTMECLTRLGLINWIGKQTEVVIQSVGEEARLAVAIMIILWVSAITSAFVDSIPVTAMMVKVVVSLAENEALSLPVQPLVWALAFGPCLGGNGLLYGASANVVCAGIAEQHGYKITFVEYMKVCFPIMIGSVVVITGYLMVAHVLFTWH